ncbi:MAG: hypothetical protein BWY88_00442 [Synergistetes bacterium ADurb.Bin520]|nr:MAG: hypothetical protein BWY88_00442 [Synergistetes bacterium ADurb.Bin520]
MVASRSASPKALFVKDEMRSVEAATSSALADCSSLTAAMSCTASAMPATISRSRSSPDRTPRTSSTAFCTEVPVVAMDCTVSPTAPRIRPTRSAMLPAVRLLSSASLRTSSATTANPRPCSPARAASMAAFSARRFVWSAICPMELTSSPMRRAKSCTSFTLALVNSVARAISWAASPS